MIEKIIQPTIDKINFLKKPKIFKLETEHFLLKDYDVLIEKNEKGFSAKISFNPSNGFSSSQMHRIELPQPIKLSNTQTVYYIPESSIHLRQLFKDFFGDDISIDIVGNIDRLSTAADDSNFDNKYLRFIIPVACSDSKLSNVRGWKYKADLFTKEKNLLKVVLNEDEYHFFEFQYENTSYLIIDSTKLCTLLDFKKICNSILLGLGFLYGNLYLDEAFILSSTTKEFKAIADYSFSIYRESIMTNYRIHTTNAYSIHDMTGKDESEIELKLSEVRKWLNYIVEIEELIFSRLCQLFYNSEPISRAAIVTLQGNLLPLEIKGSAYSLALEAISAVFMNEEKEKIPKPVEKELFKKIKLKLLGVVKEILPMEDQSANEILKARIENLNNPTNSDKLKKSFDIVGYTLNEYEQLALRARNKFQHGELPVSDDSDNVAFQELYFMTIIMHRLIYTLILKRIKYNGYIINYPQLHSNITKKELNEDVFYKFS